MYVRLGLWGRLEFELQFEFQLQFEFELQFQQLGWRRPQRLRGRLPRERVVFVIIVFVGILDLVLGVALVVDAVIFLVEFLVLFFLRDSGRHTSELYRQRLDLWGHQAVRHPRGERQLGRRDVRLGDRRAHHLYHLAHLGFPGGAGLAAGCDEILGVVGEVALDVLLRPGGRPVSGIPEVKA